MFGWYLEALKKYAVFNGRSRHKEFWYFVLVGGIIGITLQIIDRLIGTFSDSVGTGLLSGIYSLTILVPSITVCVRRLHDIGRTGWWYLMVLVPFVGAIVLLVFTVQDGTTGSNEYGSDPKTSVA